MSSSVTSTSTTTGDAATTTTNADAPSFTFFAWNVDQARREEQFAATAWDARSAAVKALIRERNADVVALLELRDLSTSSENARQFVAAFPDYDVVMRRYCHFEHSFTMALLVKPQRFFVGDVRVHNFDNRVGDDKMVAFVDLQCKSSLRWCTIGLTHFALEEPRKWHAVHILQHLIAKQPHPCAVYSDYNFFDDRDGQSQRDALLADHDDLAWPLRASLSVTPCFPKWSRPDAVASSSLVGGPSSMQPTGHVALEQFAYETALTGTFVGFPHDDFKQSIEAPSRLDHVFAPRRGGLVRVGDAATSPSLYLYRLDNTAYDTYTYPSDHLALEMTLAWPPPSSS